MSNEVTVEATLEDAVEPPVPIPHSWLSTGLGLCGLMVVAIIAIGLARQFLATRPIDLFDVSYAAADALDEWFIANQFPMDDIIRQEPRILEGAEAHSYFYDYDVTLPERLTADTVTELISSLMRERGVQVLQFDMNGAKQELSLTFNAHSFATIRLTERTSSLALPTTWGVEQPKILSQPPALPPAVESIASSLDENPDKDAPDETFEVEILEPVEPTIVVAQAEIEPEPLPAIVPVELDSMGPDTVIETKARLAIIVDDGGYGGQWTETILGLDKGLTLSILPNTPEGTALALRAQKLGFEILLHLPMENMNPKLTHPGELKTDMDAHEMHSFFLRALDQVPGAVGVNNHQGSKFTSDPQALALLMDSVDEYSLFFVDSRTTAKTRAYDVAKAFDIPAASRNLFLDNESDPEAIRRRFSQVVEFTLKNGQGIAICHFRPNTARVLEEMLPMLKEEGISLVPVSELVQ